jgi:PAS domain-containing protein
LLDRKITELGLLEQQSATRLEHDLKIIVNSVNANDAVEFWEPLSLSADRGITRLFRAHRFVFRGRKDREPFLGDISFDWGQILPGVPRPLLHDLSDRLRLSGVTPGVEELLPHFLTNCPAAIAIKDLETRMIWCNHEYEQLVPGKTLADFSGKTTRQIFALKDTHALIQNEFTVAHSKTWMYAIETLPGHNPRTSLRFPIVNARDQLGFIGVVSAEFRQEDIGSQKGFRRHTRKRRRLKI